MAEIRICNNFINNPAKNPLNPTEDLIRGSKQYNGYVAMCEINGFDVDYLKENVRTVRSTRSTSPVRTSPPIITPVRTTSPLITPVRSTSPVRTSPPIISPVRSSPQLSKSNGVCNVSIPRVVSPRKSVPDARVIERSERVGVETFDPEPVQEVIETKPRSYRTNVVGPYGPNGENKIVTGTHTLPGTRTIRTTDIPVHEVRSVYNDEYYSDGSEEISDEYYSEDEILEEPRSMVRQSLIPAPLNGSLPVIRPSVPLNGSLPVIRSTTNGSRRSYYPEPLYSERVETIGDETFDPDPYTTVSETSSSRSQKTVRGPYGENNEDVIVSGVYSKPGVRTYTTRDIPEHRVRTGNVNNNSTVRSYPSPLVSQRSERVGVETFDPNPITDVRVSQPQSVRKTVIGPYGTNGENIPITGTYTGQGTRIVRTRDIPEHEVRTYLNI